MNKGELSRREFLQSASVAGAAVVLGGEAMAQGVGPATNPAATSDFASDFANTPDRIWLGSEYWANPMEDWRVAGGRIECTSEGGNRNVHLLTRSLGPSRGSFEISVRCGMIQRGERGGVGLRIGIHDEINDYRGNCFFGEGVDAGFANGMLILGKKSQTLDVDPDLKDITISLRGENKASLYLLTLTITDSATGKSIGKLSAQEYSADALIGNIALVNNFKEGNKGGCRCWFSDWRVSGEKIETHPERRWGPILWAMHTLSNSRKDEGFVLKLTVQMAPMGASESSAVALEVQRDGKWENLGEQKIDPDARTATFRVARWNAQVQTPYRVVHGQTYWTGTIRAEPVNRPVLLGALTCQHHVAFPYGPVARNLESLNPDMLFFSGDQIYEQNGGYGIVRRPAERAIVNYLRKFYMFGWAFGDLMRDRPTVCLPDDHDVFQGNLWGEGGAAMEGNDASSRGGYIEPVRVIEVMHKTNCAHLPDPVDPTPVQQGISVYYTDLVYGRVSFAIIADRQFKSGPENVSTGGGRADHVEDKDFDVRSLDKPGLVLLGERQEEFLEQWAADWRGADLKVVLSETLLANVATHHGEYGNYLLADLDSNGWPQSGRNRAVALMRKALALHVCGDQHIGSLVQYGIERQRDSNWSFCTPAISVGYQRWWRADETRRRYTNRPPHKLENTGEYLDGLGNLVYVHAIANPTGSTHASRYRQAQLRASGFGLIRIDTEARSYTCWAYRFNRDVTKGKETSTYDGWPLTIAQEENYGRKRIGTLAEVTAPQGVDHPVVVVQKEPNGELVYAMRLREKKFKPFVFEDATYTVKIGDPEADRWEVVTSQKVQDG